jgi:hypothetical protein
MISKSWNFLGHCRLETRFWGFIAECDWFSMPNGGLVRVNGQLLSVSPGTWIPRRALSFCEFQVAQIKQGFFQDQVDIDYVHEWGMTFEMGHRHNFILPII